MTEGGFGTAAEIRRDCVVRLVDDDCAVLRTAAFVLEQEGWRVRSYSGGREFLVNDVPSEPGCVVIDFMMPDMDGLQLQAEMTARGIAVPIVFLSAHGTIDIAVEAMRAGAVHFLQKPIDPAVFLATIELSATGSWYAAELGSDPNDALRAWDALTDREIEVVRGIGNGLENKELAERFGLSPRTVENHRSSILKKLRLQSTKQLRLIAALKNRKERQMP